MNQTVAHSSASVLSIQDAIFPFHPFSGLFALGRENNWRCREMFPAFTLADDGDPGLSARISYLQAREGLLQMRQLGGADLALLSGSRKSIAQLGAMGLGLMAQTSVGAALAFGLEYQLIAGAMAKLEFEAGAQHSAIISQALFDDHELQDFLDLDHLATAVNAARSLPGPGIPMLRVELRGNHALSRSAAEAFFACPVLLGADQSRLVFATDLLNQALPRASFVGEHERHQPELLRRVCDEQLHKMGVLGKKTLVNTLIAMQCDTYSVAQMADALGISPRSLHRLLAQESTSYFHVAESVRIQNAKRLLRAGAGIEHIAEQLEYADARSLRRAFKRWTGMTPSEYRNSWQKNA